MYNQAENPKPNFHDNRHNGVQYDIKRAIEYTNSFGVVLQSPQEAMQALSSIEGHQRKYYLTRGIAIYVLDKDTPTVYFYNEKNSPIIKNASHACSIDKWIVPLRDSSLEHAMHYAKMNNNAYTNPPEKIMHDILEGNNNYTDIIHSILGDATKAYEKYVKKNKQPRLVNLLAHEAYAHIGNDNADIRCVGLDTMNNILIINAKAEPIDSYGIAQDITTKFAR